MQSEVGFEFLVELEGPQRSALKVIPEYNRHDTRVDPKTGDDFGRFSRRPVMTLDRSDGRFDSLFITTNRARFGRDGTFYRAQGYDRGRLRYGLEDSSSLADWYFDERGGLLEVRIAWDLINVTDPSSRTLLDDRRVRGRFGTAAATGFHVGVIAHRKGSRGIIVGALPSVEGRTWSRKKFRPWLWHSWTQPSSHGRLKPVYDSLKSLWREAPAGAPAPRGQTAP